MARGLNKVSLIGNLGRDPEVRQTAGGQLTVATLNLATTDSWKDKATGQSQERTEWHRIVLFGRLAEIASQYLKKGARVYIEGRLQTRKWTDQSGADRYTTEIVGNEMLMLGGSGERGSFNQTAGPEFGDDVQQQWGDAPQQPQAQSPSAAKAPAKAGAGQDQFDDDDIPF